MEDPKDLILNVIGSLYVIVKCCYGPNAQYQMLVYDGKETTTTEQDNQTITLSKKASEILKSIKMEHVFSNIVKKSVQMLESICFDGTNTLVLLIYSIFRECVIILDKGIHPISLIYSLQNSFTTIIEPSLKQLRIPLIKSLLNENNNNDEITLSNDEILKLKLKDINLNLLLNTIHSVINTKLDSDNLSNGNDDVVSNISKLCLDSLKTLYIENQLQELSVLDIMNNRISFQDQIIIYPRLLLSGNIDDSNLISNLFKNTFIIENNQSSFINDCENNFILFINEELILKSNDIQQQQHHGITKTTGTDSESSSSKKEKTKLIFHTAIERTGLLEFEKSILKNKIIQLIKLIEKVITTTTTTAANKESNIVLIFKSIDDYSKSLINNITYNSNGKEKESIKFNYLIFNEKSNNIQPQHIKIVLKSLGINSINSIDSIISRNDKSNNGDELFKFNFIGSFKRIELVNRVLIKLSKLQCKIPLLSIELYGSSNHILRQRVGSYITGMGIGKCCLEDLFILPSACCPEFTIIKSLLSNSNITKDYIDKETYQALIKSIEIIPITLLGNQNNKPILKVLDSFYTISKNDNNGKTTTTSTTAIGINLSDSDKSNDDNYFINPIEKGIFETYRSKFQTFRFAIDIVCLLLKIDQIIQPPQPSTSQQHQSQQQQQQQQQQSSNDNNNNKREYIEFKQPEISTNAIEKEKIETTKKQNELFYSKLQVEKRERFDKKFNTNPFSK